MTATKSYKPYLLQLHNNCSYYTLLGVPKTTSFTIIEKIIFELYNLLDPGNDNNHFFAIQWTDFNTISHALQNKQQQYAYNNVHHLAQYLPNTDFLVKTFTDIQSTINILYIIISHIGKSPNIIYIYFLVITMTYVQNLPM